MDIMNAAASLEQLLDNKDLKAVFIGGKGGVGKTTCSCSVALQFAQRHVDKNILLISTDPAHNVSDAFVQQFSGEPKKVTNNLGIDNLFACEVDPAASMEKELAYFSHGDSDSGIDVKQASDVNSFMDDLKGFVTNLPGIDEAMALSSVLNFLEEDNSTKTKYDVIVFDTAPTGHTLRLLQLPAVLKMGLEKLTSWKAKFANIFSSVTSMLYNSGSKDSQQDRLKRLEERMSIWLKAVTQLTKMFKDNKATQFVAVCNASFLSVYETKRLLSELKVAKIHSEFVIVNMLMPRMLSQLKHDDAVDQGSVAENVKTVLGSSGLVDSSICDAVKDAVELCGGVSRMQEHYLKILLSDSVKTGIKLVLLPLLAGEVRGTESLSAFSERLVDLDPKLSVDKHAKQKLQEFSKINVSIVDNEALKYSVETDAKLMNKAMFEEEDEVIPMDADSSLELKKGDKVKICGLKSKQELNGKVGVVCKTDTFMENGRVGVEIVHEGKKSAMLLKPTNLELESSTPGPSSDSNPLGVDMDNVTPELMSLVQSMIMKPGGINEMLTHKHLLEMKSNDPKILAFCNDIEQNGLFAGLRYMSDKYVMSRLGQVAKKIQAEQ